MNSHPEVIIIPAFLLTIAYIVSLALSTWRVRQRLKAVTEFHTRLIDRLGSIKGDNHGAAHWERPCAAVARAKAARRPAARG
jgi:hypothetical protein